jgi:hypothetical protein
MARPDGAVAGVSYPSALRRSSASRHGIACETLESVQNCLTLRRRQIILNRFNSVLLYDGDDDADPAELFLQSRL